MLLKSKDKTQTVDFTIPKKYKKILINVSGGADSALLLYLTIKYLKNNGMDDVEVNAMTCANSAKGNWNARKAADVIHHVITRSEFENFNMHYSFYRDEQQANYFNEVFEDLLRKGVFDLFMHGTTANPLESTIVINSKGIPIDLREKALPDRDKKNYDLLYENIVDGIEYGMANPWYNVDKRFIADQYDIFNLRDDLLPITRSCEFRLENAGIKKLLNNDEFENTPCGVCWWCLERKWAFGHF
jgi:hypothetical protein